MDVDIENYMKSINLEAVCRTCLTDSDEMTSLFSEVVTEEPDTEEEETIVLYEILTTMSPMQITEDDGLSTLICKKCVEFAMNAYKFKTHCERTEALLQTFISKRIKNENTQCESEHEANDQETEHLLNESAQETEKEIMDEHEMEEITEETNEEPRDDEIEEGTIASVVCVEELIVPDLASDDMDKKELLIEDESIDEKPDILDVNNQNQALLVASSEENVRLRQRIAMKKMRNLEGSLLTTNKPNILRRRQNYCYPYKHNEKGEKIYYCPVCKKEYKHSTSLTVHIRNHTLERPYLCNLCGKGFKQFTGLNYHMRSHTGEQPYACTLCEKRYRQSASLTAHMRVHTGQRPFLCSVCGKGFRQAPDLGYHMRTHTKEKPYMCSVCGKRMSMQCHLVQHMRIHTGEKPYKCNDCEKAFASSTRLKRHEIIHTNLRPFVCKDCGKSFNRSSTLRVHCLIHSEVRPYVCHVCGRGFIQSRCLKVHMKTHLKKEREPEIKCE